MDRYPLALYRPGTALRIWDTHDCDFRVAHDAEAEAAAKREGWSESPIPADPLDHDLNGKRGGSLPRRRKPA